MSVTATWSAMKSIWTHVLTDNFVIKFFLWIWAVFMNEIYSANEILINWIIVLYLIDLFLWVKKALKHKIFSSRQFFKWATKIVVYWLFLYVWFLVDQATWIDYITTLLLVFMLTTDWASIFENLEELGYDVPQPIIQLFKLHKNKFFYNKIREVTWWEVLFDYKRDFDHMRNTYIPLIKEKKNRDLFNIKINTLEWFVSRVANIPINDCWKFKIEFNILLNAVGDELRERLYATTYSNQQVDIFLQRHFFRVWAVLKEINEILPDNKKFDKETRLQIKNNVLQAVIRIIFTWIWDNINAKD